MERKLKRIIEEHGLDVLSQPDDLCSFMLEQKITKKDVYTTMLILQCCPTVASTLSLGEMTTAEANALLRSAVINTGLSAGTVRKVLGALLHACGVKTDWSLHLAFRDKYVNKSVLPSVGKETSASELAKQLQSADPESEVFSDLHNLAVSGNVKAAYALGKYYRTQDLKEGDNRGEQYFAMARSMGYGPADGALADYELRRTHKHMWRIAQRFQYPSTLSGQDGREWISLSQKLLEYRQANTRRLQSTLVMQIFVLILTVLMISTVPCGTWGSTAAVLQVIGLVWTAVCRFFKPFHSARTACYLMILSWAILVLAAF